MNTTEYKESEVGRIPADWTVKQIGKIGYTYSGLTGKGKDDFGKGDAQYITFLNVLNNPVLKTDIFEKVDISEGEHQNKALKGDLFFNTSSETPEEVGICALLNEDIPNLYLNSFCFGYRLTDPEVDGLFLSYLFRSKKGRDIMTSLAQGATRYNLSKEFFNKTLIAFPPLYQQKQIARTLGDIDVLLSKQDSEIEKKRLIKEGLMQQLLTGSMRLQGFSGDWIEKSIGEIGDLTGAGVDKLSVETERPVRLINYLDVFHRDYIYDDELNFWVTASDRKCEKCNVIKGDVFFTPSSEMPYDIALSAVSMEDMPGVCYSYHIYRLRFKEEIDLNYKAYLFKTASFYKQASTLCEGSGKRYVLSMPKFRSMTVKFPKDIAEQKAIAEVLSSTDKEIKLLEVNREKYFQIKQGMMQQLLTGKTRLI